MLAVQRIMLFLLLVLPLTAGAVTLEGRLAYRRGDYAAVLRELVPGSRPGPVDAFFLSLMYSRGTGVARDEARALELLKESADGGYFAAQYQLGQRYLYGVGVPKDRSLAMSYLLAAAAGDDYRAVTLLKIIEKGSRGEKKDRENVTATVKRMAKANVPAAQTTLALMYLIADEVPKDGAEEVRWYRAASTRHPRAAFVLSLMYQSGEGVPKSVEESYRLMRIAAEMGDVRAQYFLGTFCYQGIGTPVDRAAAAIWFKKSAESGFDEAQLAYGMLLLSGDGVAVDKSAAIEWLSRAASQDNIRAREVVKELLTYRGRPAGPVPAEPPSTVATDRTQGESQLRLEGKGVILDQGTFGLKFSLPTLYDAYAPPNQTVANHPIWERLQGGTFDIIFRQSR